MEEKIVIEEEKIVSEEEKIVIEEERPGDLLLGKILTYKMGRGVPSVSACS